MSSPGGASTAFHDKAMLGQIQAAAAKAAQERLQAAERAALLEQQASKAEYEEAVR